MASHEGRAGPHQRVMRSRLPVGGRCLLVVALALYQLKFWPFENLNARRGRSQARVFQIGTGQAERERHFPDQQPQYRFSFEALAPCLAVFLESRIAYQDGLPLTNLVSRYRLLLLPDFDYGPLRNLNLPTHVTLLLVKNANLAELAE